ncbi:MAG TPA: DUF6510 family protein [Propionibacteriaceae bacterium]|jgi:hypothetical protein
MDGDELRKDGTERADDERVGAQARLDGNAAAGMLSEVFVHDFTSARTTCATCGAVRSVGALLVYAHGMGMVMRCPGCNSVVMRIAQTPGRLLLDATGARLVTLAAAVPVVA